MYLFKTLVHVMLLVLMPSFAEARIGEDAMDIHTDVTRKEDKNYWSRLLQVDMSVPTSPTPAITPSPTESSPISSPSLTSSPIETPGVVETVQADFGDASPSNIIELEAVVTSPDAIVEVFYPLGAQVFVADMQDDIETGGATCLSVSLGSSEVEGSGGFVVIPLNGIDTVIYACQNGVIVGRCIHVYGSSPRYITFNFQGAAVGKFISFNFNVPSGGGVAGIGGCTGCSLYFLSGSGIGGGGGGTSGGGGGGGGFLGPGDPCLLPEGAEFIPNDSGFTLFSIEEDTVIYACQNGVVVGRCVVIGGTTQSPMAIMPLPTSLPTSAPVITPLLTSSPTAAPISVPTEPPVECCDLPAGFDASGNQYGVFGGIVDQSNTGSYDVTIDYSPAGIITTYPQLGCGNSVPVEPSLVAKGRLEWTERIEFGSNCIDGGRVTLVQNGDEWDYLLVLGSIQVRGPLFFECTAECPSAAPSGPTPTASPTVFSCEGNFLFNGDFEFGNTTGWNNPGAVVAESPNITWENFPFSPGAFILYGGEGSSNKVMSQSVDLSPFAAVIDQEEMQFVASAWLVSLQPAGVSFVYDEALLSVAFYDEAGTELLRTPELTDPTFAGDLPPDASIWDLVSEQGTIPSSTRSAMVFLRFYRPIGIETGAYADNVFFCVTEATPAPTPSIT